MSFNHSSATIRGWIAAINAIAFAAYLPGYPYFAVEILSLVHFLARSRVVLQSFYCD